MRKIRLVYVVSTLGRTGPTRQLYNLIKHLDYAHFEAQVITLSSNPPDNLERDFAELGIATRSLKLSRLAGVIYGQSRLATVLDELQPDVLHSQGLRADWLCSRLADSYKKVATQRNNPLQDYPLLMGQLKGTVAARLHYRALARLPVVVACSQTIADANTLRGLSTSVIHNGVDLNLTKAPMNHEGRTAPRHALGLPEAGRLFLYAGPLIPRKNPELLIRAMMIQTKHKDSLLVLGDGPLLESYLRGEQEDETILPAGVWNPPPGGDSDQRARLASRRLWWMTVRSQGPVFKPVGNMILAKWCLDFSERYGFSVLFSGGGPQAPPPANTSNASAGESEHTPAHLPRNPSRDRPSPPPPSSEAAESCLACGRWSPGPRDSDEENGN